MDTERNLSQENSVRLCRVENEMEALFLKEALTQEGISCMVRSFRDSAYNGLFAMGRGWGEVRVLESDYGPANVIWEEVQAAEFGDNQGDEEREKRNS